MKKFFVNLIKIISFLVLPIFFTLLTAALSTILAGLFQPENTLFVVATKFTWLIFIVEIILLIFLGANFFKPSYLELKYFSLSKNKIIISTIVYIGILYLMASNQAYVTKDTILVRNSLNLTGTLFEYEDVIGVQTGFKDDGEFYYFITLINGERINFNMPSYINEDMYDDYDSYLEIYEFDKTIMKNNISKISIPSSIKFCIMDDVYRNRLEEILLNK